MNSSTKENRLADIVNNQVIFFFILKSSVLMEFFHHIKVLQNQWLRWERGRVRDGLVPPPRPMTAVCTSWFVCLPVLCTKNSIFSTCPRVEKVGKHDVHCLPCE